MIRRPEAIRGVTIAGTGRAVPDRVLTNFDLEGMVDTSDQWILERTGIRERRIAAPHEASSDFATTAAKRALEAAGLVPGDVDYLIVATTTPDRYLPSCACTVQQKLGASRAAAFDLFAACTGFVFGIGMGRALVRAGTADTVVVIGVETLSRIVDYSDRNTCVLFGDAAGAVVLRPCAPGDGVLAVDLHSDGELGEVLEIPSGGSASPASAETVARKEHFIRMKGKKLFPFAVRTMEESLRTVMSDAGLTPADLALVIPHQANLRIIDAVRERLDVPPERVVVNIDRYGNTSSATIPVALDEVHRAGQLRIGDHVAFAAFGGGATWGAGVVRWTLAAPDPLEPMPTLVGSAGRPATAGGAA